TAAADTDAATAGTPDNPVETVTAATGTAAEAQKRPGAAVETAFAPPAPPKGNSTVGKFFKRWVPFGPKASDEAGVGPITTDIVPGQKPD
ncbi:MAG: transcriptional regulator, partial [Roseibium sp.]